MFYLLNFFINSKTCSLFLSFLLIVFPSFIQRGKDHLNEQEVERVREAQLVDLRTKVFLHIAERRLNVILGLTPPSINEKDAKNEKKDGKDKKKDKKKKDEEEEKIDDFGPEPTGTTAQLLDNYTRVISELLDKLDDAFEKKKDDDAFEKAIEKIIDKSQNHLKLLEKISSTKVNSPDEERALGKAVETIETALTGARSFKSENK